MSTCKVTLFTRIKVAGRFTLPACGRPVVAHGLCEKHYADRLRLGGGK